MTERIKYLRKQMRSKDYIDKAINSIAECMTEQIYEGNKIIADCLINRYNENNKKIK